MTPYYSDEAVTIYNADCRDVLPSLDVADLLLTDPPYGAGYAANPIVGKGKSRSNHDAQSWDGKPCDWLLTLFRYASQQVIWGGNYYPLPPSRGWLVWYKRDAPPSMADAELAWTSKDMNTQLFDWPIAASNGQRFGHPTQKPVELIRWSIRRMGESQIVLDPFMSSGTTLRAAKDLGRKAIGIEIEERYCEIAAKRMSQEVFNFNATQPAMEATA